MAEDIPQAQLTEMIPAIILLAFTLLILWGIVGFYVERDVETETLESYLLMNRLLYSPNCLAVYENDRTYVGQVDLNNFNAERLENCANKKSSGVKLSLSEMDGTEIKSVSFGDVEYALYLCNVKGNFQCGSRRIVVPLLDGFEVRNAVLDIGVVIKDEQ